jgi:hypothetical protein
LRKKSLPDAACHPLNPSFLPKYLSNWAEILDLGSHTIIVGCIKLFFPDLDPSHFY